MAGWSKSHELSRCVVHFTAIGCVLCTYCCICMIAVGERCFDCCKSCNLVDISICQFPPMVCMISSIACDIQFRGICVQAPVGLQPFFFAHMPWPVFAGKFCWPCIYGTGESTAHQCWRPHTMARGKRREGEQSTHTASTSIGRNSTEEIVKLNSLSLLSCSGKLYIQLYPSSPSTAAMILQ